MKMWIVRIQDSEYLVGKAEKEFLERAFKSSATYEEIELPENDGSGTMGGDE